MSYCKLYSVVSLDQRVWALGLSFSRSDTSKQNFQTTGWSKKSEVIAIQCKEYKIKRKEISYKYIYITTSAFWYWSRKETQPRKKEIKWQGERERAKKNRSSNTTVVYQYQSRQGSSFIVLYCQNSSYSFLWNQILYSNLVIN